MLGASLAPLRAGAATVLALAIGFMVFCALRRTPSRRGPIKINSPDTKLLLTQLIFTTVDVLAAAATLWVLLPSVGISFFSFAAIYAAALAPGVLSHIPGGLGVFELAILYSVGRNAPVNAVAAALVTYRAIYCCSPCSSRPSCWRTSNCSGRSTRQWVDGSVVRRASLHPHFLAVTTFVVGAIFVVSGASRRSSIGCKSCRSGFRSGRSRSLISSPASPVSSCYLPRTASTYGSTELGGSLCA